MSRTPLNALLTEKALAQLSLYRNTALIDMIAEDSVEHNVPLKNVCAKVHPALSDRIDNICGFLDISKRRFLEAAFIEACQMAEAIIQAEGVNDLLETISDRRASEAPEGEA